ncbi:Ucr-2.2 [Aphelenchoides fujianensis]|nr:Ucr-2.2 [Aphelenchoides fujianensis]
MISVGSRTAALLLLRHARLQCCSTALDSSVLGGRLLHSSARRTADEDGPTPGDRPHMFQLEHVQKRVEHCVPLMFKEKLDYTFYRKDVVLDDQIFGVQKVGIYPYINYLGFIRCDALNIIPMLDDGTVRLRWRVRYLSWGSWLNPRHVGKSWAEREKTLRWFDGYSIFVVDGTGLVSRVTLQKSQPNDEKEGLAKKTKKIAQKIAQIPTANSSRPAERF